MKIERAQKKKQKLKIALAGISGSGKTYSALTLAFSMCNKVCVIDTECGSASLYSDHFPEYDVLELTAPYSPQRYMEAITAVEKAGYECIIVDSLSHEWNGAGGCLDMVNAVTKADSRGNSYTAWGKVTPHHDALIARMISAQTHMIVTMRTKTAYEMGTNDKGKQAPVKVGMAPTQRDGVEYEFTIVFDIDQNHNFTCSKDRTAMFNNVDIPQPLNADIGKKILEWLESGVEVVAPIAKLQSVETPKVEISLPEGVSRENFANIRGQFAVEAGIIKEAVINLQNEPGSKYCTVMSNGNTDWNYTDEFFELRDKFSLEWYSLCNKYMCQNDWFVVPQNVAEKMHGLLGLQKPIVIKQGYIDYGETGDYLAELLKSKEKAVNETSGSDTLQVLDDPSNAFTGIGLSETLTKKLYSPERDLQHFGY